jgi:hypothetical protein
MIISPTKEHKMEGRNELRPIQVATCHGMSNLNFHPHKVLHNFCACRNPIFKGSFFINIFINILKDEILTSHNTLHKMTKRRDLLPLSLVFLFSSFDTKNLTNELNFIPLILNFFLHQPQISPPADLN